MTHSWKAVYAAAAEVMGMTFLYLSEKEKETEGPIHDHVINMLMSINQSKPDNFVTCVLRMQRHYAPIADRCLLLC